MATLFEKLGLQQLVEEMLRVKRRTRTVLMIRFVRRAQPSETAQTHRKTRIGRTQGSALRNGLGLSDSHLDTRKAPK